MLTAVVTLVAGLSLGAEAEPPPTAAGSRSAEVRGLFGLRAFAAGKWGLVGVYATNPTDEPSWLRTNCFFADDPNLQFGRELWLPPRARRWSWCPVRTPDETAAEMLEIRSVGEDHSGPQVQPLAAPDGGLWSSSALPRAYSPTLTAIVGASATETLDEAALEVVRAVRHSRKLKTRVSSFWEDLLPPTAESLEALSQVVICGDQPASDSAGCAALRDWVRGGGKLWIMLDLVQPETVRLLLGDTCSYQAVDRVGLTRVEFRLHHPNGDEELVEGTREHDLPVDLLRVLVRDVQVMHTVNGWPASFWVEFGAGRVLFTTLGARAWFRPSTGRRGDPEEPTADETLLTLATGLFADPKPPPLSPDHVTALLTEQVGYRILGRGAVWAILGGFCAAFVAAGIWLRRRERLEHLGWIGPACALVAAGLLAGLGLQSRRSVPPTVAVLEHVQAAVGNDELSVTGQLAFYQPEPGELLPSSLVGGFLRPDMTGLERGIRRVVWTGADAWHWEKLALPGGVRFADFRQTVRLPEPLVARGTFGPEGFSGTLTGPLVDRGDAVLIGSSGTHQAVQFAEDGQFLVPRGEPLPPGRYVAASLLTDEQRRRQAVYQEFFATQPVPPAPEPRLYLWCQPLTLGVPLPDEMRQAGSALACVPVRIERLPAGSRGVIPAPFLEYHAVQGSKKAHASAYQSVARKWLPLRIPAETWLRFQLPVQTLPFELERATLTIQIDAPQRPVEILHLAESGPVSLRTWQGPLGAIRFSWDRAEALRLDADGGLTLGVRVGESGAERKPGALTSEQGVEWSIESVALEVAGRAAAAK